VHNSSPQQLLIGLMEGVMMRLHVIIMALGKGQNESEKVNELAVVDAIVGSGAVLEKVHVWRQMLADITNLPVIVLKQINGEATSNGLALHMLKSEEKTEDYQPLKEDGLPISRKTLFGFDKNEVEVVSYPISRNHTIYQQRFLLSQRMYEQHSMSSPASTSIENDVNQLLEIEATLKRQQVEMDTERSEIAAARRQLELDLQEAEHKKEKAEEAAQIAEKRRREASAEIMFKKAISRNSLHAAEHKRDEAQAAELLAEERLREAEDKRRLAEEIEFKLQEEIAAMATLKEELDDTMTEPLEFVKNTAELSPSGLQSCLKIIPVLLSNPTLAICIDGHTNCFLDKCKDHCTHVQLSQLRVDAVKEQLTRGGAHNNILTKGWGCKHPELKNKRAVRIYPVPKHAIKLHKMTSL
jgi:outer membrane protein OmpA-like peptidoglycan-associated protein